jgi:5-methyltetrahydrofolate--homocysteine methyltransferase
MGHVREVASIVSALLEEGVSAHTILNEGLLHGLEELGIRFRHSEIFIAELLQASKAMSIGMGLIKDRLRVEGSAVQGKVIIATVAGDLHDIGKNLVKYMLEGVGLDVIDLGSNVSADQIVEATRKHRPDIVALSALLTTTMEYQHVVVDALKAAGLRDSVLVIVGGAPVSNAYSRSIGADGYAIDASETVDLVKQLLSDKKGNQ